MFIPKPGEGPEGVQRRSQAAQSQMRSKGIDPSRFGWGMPRRGGQPGSMTPSKPGPGRPSVPMQNYAPGQAKPQQSPYATSTPYGQQQPPAPSMPPSGSGSPFPVLIDGRGGQQPNRPPSLYGPDPMTVSPSGHPMHILMHNPQQQPASRPPPFQSTTRNFDGTTSQMPNFQQRDAFISQINNQLGQMQQQSWQRPGMGAPQFNFPQMWGQAGKMAEQGFRNPFAAPPPRQVSPGGNY